MSEEGPEIQPISLQDFQEGIKFLAEAYHKDGVSPEQQAILANNISDLIAVAYNSNKDNWAPFKEYMDLELYDWPNPAESAADYPEIATNKDTFDTRQKVTSIIYQARKAELKPVIQEKMEAYAAQGYSKKEDQGRRWRIYEGIPPEGQVIVWGIIDVLKEKLADKSYPMNKLAASFEYLIQYYQWKSDTPDINPFSGTNGLGSDHPIARWLRKALAERVIQTNLRETDAQSYTEIIGYTSNDAEDKNILDTINVDKAGAARAMIFLNAAKEYAVDAKQSEEGQRENIERACHLLTEALALHPRLEKIRDVFNEIRETGRAENNPVHENVNLVTAKGKIIGVLRRNMLRRISKETQLRAIDKGGYEGLTSLFLTIDERGKFLEQRTPAEKIGFGSNILKLKRVSDVINHPEAYADMPDGRKVQYISSELASTIDKIPMGSLEEWHDTLEKTLRIGKPPLASVEELKTSNNAEIISLRLGLAKRISSDENLPDLLVEFFMQTLGNEAERNEAAKIKQKSLKRHVARKIAERLLTSA